METAAFTEYDLLSNPIVQKDPCAFATQTSYNIRGQPANRIYSDGTHEHFFYDMEGNLTCSLAKNGSYTKTSYDALLRPTLIQIFSPQNELLQKNEKQYNTFHLLQETDPQGITTHYT